MTTGVFKKMLELYKSGMTDRGIAEIVGCSSHTVGDWRKSMGLPVNRKKVFRVPSTYYRVIDKRTREVITEGQSKDCAKALGLTLKSFYKTMCRVRAGEHAKYILEEKPFMTVVVK